MRGQLKSGNPAWANQHYDAILLHDSLRARRWRDKLRVWLAPPGWRPPDVAARFPKPPYDPRCDFSRYDPPRATALSLYVLAQFALLMAAHSHWLALLAKQPAAVSVAYFLFLLTSLVTLGGLLENRCVFRILEAGRLILVAAAVLGLGEWFGGVRNAGARIGIAPAAASLAWVMRAGRAVDAQGAGIEWRST